MARVNVSKDYNWGLKEEESTMKVVSKELGTYGEFKKMGKYKNFDYLLDLCNARMHFGYNARTDRGALELNHYAFIPLDQFKHLSHKD